MEFRQLEYFIAVVETGSISAASRKVHVAQPALTRQMRLLEEDVGTRLLDRHARGIRLTVAGRALYGEATRMLDERADLKTRLLALGSGQTGKLSLGVTVTHLWVPEVARLMGGYRRRYPHVALDVFPLLSGPQLEKLQQGGIDVGIIYHDDHAPSGIKAHLLQRDHLILAVPTTSSWAQLPPTNLAELAGVEFVWGYRSISPVYHDRVVAHFSRLNFEPHVVQYGADNITILSMVAAGLGVAIVPAASRSHPMPGIHFIELDELTTCDMPLWLAWRIGNITPVLDNFIQMAVDIFE
ncbi:LysR family transcriptional regulator [Vreelandella nigrificans]|uniref:LysR family transcriptional regulator n=1 Tax=Vreelandella nigrificans TaxID=2042704 RepID=A0A2A4HNT0_9GAMM|nr:LysR family transcriptional regulator [Halomonas nigrificans]PCF96436.1 LysR family transcriptional regulator [Halomonas nigrificans]